MNSGSCQRSKQAHDADPEDARGDLVPLKVMLPLDPRWVTSPSSFAFMVLEPPRVSNLRVFWLRTAQRLIALAIKSVSERTTLIWKIIAETRFLYKVMLPLDPRRVTSTYICLYGFGVTEVFTCLGFCDYRRHNVQPPSPSNQRGKGAHDAYLEGPVLLHRLGNDTTQHARAMLDT